MDELLKKSVIGGRPGQGFRKWMNTLNEKLKEGDKGYDLISLDIEFPDIVFPYESWYDQGKGFDYVIETMNNMIDLNPGEYSFDELCGTMGLTTFDAADLQEMAEEEGW